MPITFSEQFYVPAKILEATGVFDIILDIDTRVFIDPALLELCVEPEFSGARKKVEKYFSNIITLLRHSKRSTDMYWRRADRMLTFTELSGTCFGYSQNGTGGNAIGPVLRKSILDTIKELMPEGETDPILFELLGVFQEGIGCDRVSDLITFILREDILKYTQRIVELAGIDSITVSFSFVSINETSFMPFLSYKIESILPDEDDIGFSFNALFPKFDSVKELKFVISDKKWYEYITSTEADKKGILLETIGYGPDNRDAFIKEIYKKICASYIYNLRQNNYGDLLFNVCVDLPTINGNFRKTLIALKYHPGSGEMSIVTIT